MRAVRDAGTRRHIPPRTHRPIVAPAAPGDGLPGWPLRIVGWHWWIVAPALAVALVAAPTWWLQRTASFEQYLAETAPGSRPDATWFLWSRAPEVDGPAVVALEPGGPPLSGHWEYWLDRYHGIHRIFGGGTAAELTPRGSSSAFVKWGGTCTGDLRAVGNEVWTEFVRRGCAADFEALGNDESLVGPWRAPALGLGTSTVDLRRDGRLLNDRGIECGRWAGRGRLILVYLESMMTRPEVVTLVRQEPSWIRDRAEGVTRYGMYGGDPNGLYR